MLIFLLESPALKIEKTQIQQILRSRLKPTKQDSDQQTISVDVLSIVANAAVTISKDSDIFFENEILAVVHRVKSKSSGLATTSVWCWMGRETQLGDKEEKKLSELAKRYGTTPKFIHQLSEPSELVQILGGRLAIRQGSRNHWTSENTTMHLVRSLNDVILVDEHDLSIRNLCSAFSYCFTILGSIYIWHGCGSTPKERQAALSYAQTLSPDPVSPTELVEGENDDDELFWMMLGDEDFARADYWRWRRASAEVDPSIWRIDCRNPSKLSSPVEFLSTERNLQASVYIINCVWEFFVLVGKEARGERQAILTALQIAKRMSEEVASGRPFKPTVHVLIVPSQLPVDLRLGIRDMDEAWLNNGEIPHHLNLISCVNAEEHLKKFVWERSSLADLTLLPLGISADHISR
ncbi:hypothetical protein CPB83DRAFT_765018 [Crepidotus variabilis]|uniref:DUF7904 domain-containing protein n=1 Tax=Crepidotus variabilis TaxID=179855 RepID=A0A9P6JQP7_9AGAR|nr:hypothetical protein CPB83DRAFT_765018 [Crepidotus variabilis]